MIGRFIFAGLVLTFGLLANGPVIEAREFRQSARIPTPKLEAINPGGSQHLPALPGVRTTGLIPIPRRDVKTALQRVFNAWGTAGLRSQLARHFASSNRLADSVRSFAPKDARVRVLGVSSVQTNEQSILRGQGPDGKDLLITRVTATATTQVEYNDPGGAGYQQVRGRNDYVLQLFHVIEGRLGQ